MYEPGTEITVGRFTFTIAKSNPREDALAKHSREHGSGCLIWTATATGSPLWRGGSTGHTGSARRPASALYDGSSTRSETRMTTLNWEARVAS